MRATQRGQSLRSLVLLNVILCTVGGAASWVAFEWLATLNHEKGTVSALEKDLRQTKVWNHSQALATAEAWDLVATTTSLPVGPIREVDLKGSLFVSNSHGQLEIEASDLRGFFTRFMARLFSEKTWERVYGHLAVAPAPHEKFLLSAEITRVAGSSLIYPCLAPSLNYAFCLFDGGYSIYYRSLPIIKEQTSAIYSDANTPNRLAVLAEGPRLSFFINARKVNEISDPNFQPSRVGIVIIFEEAESAAFIFNQFNLRSQAKPPRQKRCKRVVVNARQFTSAKNAAGFKKSDPRNLYPLVGTSAANGEGSSRLEYSVPLSASCELILRVYYAFSDSDSLPRPVNIAWNSAVVAAGALTQPTGGFLPSNVSTSDVAVVSGHKGRNVLAVYTDPEGRVPLPHLLQFELIPAQ